MKKIFFLLTIVIITSLPEIFSQEVNEFGLHAEFGVWGELTKRGDKWGGHQIFLTPIYAIGENTNVGVGVGLRWYNNSDFDESMTSYPLYVNASYRFNGKKVKPFIEGKIGYNYLKKNYYVMKSLYPDAEHIYSPTSTFLPTDELYAKTRGGLFLSPSVGVLIRSLSLSISYSYDRESYKYKETSEGDFTQKTGFNQSIALRIGFIF